MLLLDQSIEVPLLRGEPNLIQQLGRSVCASIRDGDTPVRIAITQTRGGRHYCEMGLLSDSSADEAIGRDAIFAFRKRSYENAEQFNAVLVVPTGIGAEIGGHAGDAAPVARMLATMCDTLITHPNVVSASHINELPENGLFVEGSTLTRLLMGNVTLQKVRSNRVMMIVEDHPDSELVLRALYSATEARTSMGVTCEQVVRIPFSLRMKADYTASGRASGQVENVDQLVRLLRQQLNAIDAVAIVSAVEVPPAYRRDYFRSPGTIVNPWGGVEAMLTHALSLVLNIPCAHAPLAKAVPLADLTEGLVDPRMAAEAGAACFAYCAVKGLHRSPRILPWQSGNRLQGMLSAEDISCLIIPDGCIGLPTLAALEQGIPVIAVRENWTCMDNDLRTLPFRPGKLFIVENYLEAAGVMAAIKSGVALASIRRGLRHPTLVNGELPPPPLVPAARTMTS